VGVHKRRLADASADCRGTARRAPPFAYPRVGVHQRPGPSRRGMGRRQDSGATTQPGRVSDPPLPRPAPFTIRHSLFAIRCLFLFAIRCLSPSTTRHSQLATRHSLLAARRSPSFTIRYSRFAIRCLSPFATRHSLLAARCSPSFSTRTVCPRRRKHPGYVPVYRRHKVWSQDRNASGCVRLTSTQSFPYRALQSFD
jgi:hypothetical protein